MNKIAILYLSSYGHTKKYVDWLAEELEADVFLADQVEQEELSKYSVFIVGGGMYAGGWMGQSVVQKHYEKLKDKEWHVFTVGLSDVTIDELLNKGIYITTAVKTPKTEYTVPKSKITQDLSILEKEMDLFPHLKVIMLMGDVAKKSFNELIKRKGHKSVIPSGATYKIREEAYYYDKIRVFPSYIMTGKNILIEKSKRQMITEDIKEMMSIVV